MVCKTVNSNSLTNGSNLPQLAATCGGLSYKKEKERRKKSNKRKKRVRVRIIYLGYIIYFFFFLLLLFFFLLKIHLPASDII